MPTVLSGSAASAEKTSCTAFSACATLTAKRFAKQRALRLVTCALCAALGLNHLELWKNQNEPSFYLVKLDIILNNLRHPGRNTSLRLVINFTSRRLVFLHTGWLYTIREAHASRCFPSIPTQPRMSAAPPYGVNQGATASPWQTCETLLNQKLTAHSWALT